MSKVTVDFMYDDRYVEPSMILRRFLAIRLSAMRHEEES
jgi:hypothetical protein